MNPAGTRPHCGSGWRSSHPPASVGSHPELPKMSLSCPTGMRLVGALTLLVAAPAAPAVTIVDGADNGSFWLESTDNISIFSSRFEVGFDSYDGDGGTFEDDKAFGNIVYRADKPGIGVPAGEAFTSVSIDVSAWDGRNQFDGQGINDLYSVDVSSDGVTYTPVALVFPPVFPSGDPSGFTDTTGVASGFLANYVRVNIVARVEAAGSGFNDPWSAGVLQTSLTTVAIPEPSAIAVALVGVVLAARRR